jgi:nondiscriminating glutamyl-tRNA synthetase
MLKAFSLERLGKSGSVFDPDKLAWMNAQYLHHASGARLRAWSGEFVPPAAAALGPEALERLLEVERGNIATLADLPRELAWFLDDPPALEADAAAALEPPAARQLCAAFASDVRALAEWSADGFKSALQSLGKRLGVKGRDLFQPVRAALTGRGHGPELPLVASLLGQERCARRLEAAARGR